MFSGLRASLKARSAESWAMPRDPYIREKYTREVKTARAVARDYFECFPKDRYETSVESWRHLQCDNYEFTMRRLREPKPS